MTSPTYAILQWNVALHHYLCRMVLAENRNTELPSFQCHMQPSAERTHWRTTLPPERQQRSHAMATTGTQANGSNSEDKGLHPREHTVQSHSILKSRSALQTHLGPSPVPCPRVALVPGCTLPQPPALPAVCVCVCVAHSEMESKNDNHHLTFDLHCAQPSKGTNHSTHLTPATQGSAGLSVPHVSVRPSTQCSNTALFSLLLTCRAS